MIYFVGQNEELTRLGYKILVEQQSSGNSGNITSAETYQPSILFPINSLTQLLEIETQLEVENEAVKNKQKLSEKSLSNQVVRYKSIRITG